jgi:murein DD-endopeptidase MepM/ murein hydrolase activator NlpD/sugar lactone lactonase YvrE
VAALAAGVGVAAASLALRMPSRKAESSVTVPGWIGVVTTVAGDGAPGVADGPAAAARFSDPFGIAIGEAGAVYVADGAGANRLRRVDPDGRVTTVAGAAEGFRDGPAAVAAFDTPSGIAIDRHGSIHVADTGNHAVRRIASDGAVSTLAGDGVAGYVDGIGRTARFDGPIGVAVDRAGSVFVTDAYNDRIRKIALDGTVTTLAGATGPGYRDGPAHEALFDTPCGIVVNDAGDVFVADTGNHAVRRIGPDGIVTTVGGTGPESDVVREPTGLAVTGDGFLYVTDRRGQIVQIHPDGRASSVAGTGPGFADGPGRQARFNRLAGLALAPGGGLVVTDSANHLVRRIDPLGSGRDPGASRPPSITTPPHVPLLTRETLQLTGLAWPLDPQASWHELAGTVGEPRGGPGTDGRGRFHAGIDVPGDLGATVRAVREEKVSGPLPVTGVGGLNEAITVGIVSYAHLRVGRDVRDRPLGSSPFVIVPDEAGHPSRVRVRRGTRIRAGDPLGTINAARHTHLEVGPRGAELNPLALGPMGFVDAIPPTIVPGGVRIYDHLGRRVTRSRKGRLLLSGDVRIVLEAFDQVDGNRSRRRLGLYRAGYQVLTPGGQAAPGFETPRVTIEFDRLSPESAAPILTFEEESGITVYGSVTTRFRYIVTNTVRGRTVEPGVWRTSELAPGDYVLRVIAGDFSGNEAMTNRDLSVSIEPVTR